MHSIRGSSDRLCQLEDGESILYLHISRHIAMHILDAQFFVQKFGEVTYIFINEYVGEALFLQLNHNSLLFMSQSKLGAGEHAPI